MLIETPKRLPENMEMLCYACEEESATHLCRYQIGELNVQVCLCDLCMKIDTKRLLENTIGIQELSYLPTVESCPKENRSTDRSVNASSWSIHI